MFVDLALGVCLTALEVPEAFDAVLGQEIVKISFLGIG